MVKVIIGPGLKRKVIIPLLPQKNYWLTFSRILKGGTMKTVILEVRDPKDAMGQLNQAWSTNQRRSAYSR